MPADFGSGDAHANSIVTANVLDAPSAMSLAMWIYVTTDPAGTSSITSKRSAAQGGGWQLRLASDRKPGFVTTDGGSNESSPSNLALTAATWEHLVVSWDGSDVYFFVDGSKSGGLTGHTHACGTSANSVDIGNAINADAGAAVSIAHLMGWDVALSDDEVASLYAGGLVQTDNLVHWYSGDGDPGKEQMSGGVATKNNTVVFTGILAAHSGSPRPGEPGRQVLLDMSPWMRPQYCSLEPGPQLNRQNLLLDDYGPVMPQHGDVVQLTHMEPSIKPQHVTLVEHGPFLNPQHIVLAPTALAVAGRDQDGSEGRVRGESELGSSISESITTPGTSSETVTARAPSTISTTWTKGYTALTTVWKKGRNSYV